MNVLSPIPYGANGAAESQYVRQLRSACAKKAESMIV